MGAAMKAIRRTAFGDPRRVLDMVDMPDAGPVPPDSVLIEMQYSPIHQHDLQMDEVARHWRSVPCTAGSEGLGKVIACGENVSEKWLDSLVLAPTVGTWSERLIARAAQLVALPRADPLQLSMLRINPSTASLLLSEFTSLAPGDWIIQNSANSGVGRSVIAFAKLRGIRTINVVRRPEVMDEMTELTDGAVLLDCDDDLGHVQDITQGSPVRLGLDAVGDTSTARLARALSPKGTLVSYANLQGLSRPADLRPLIEKGICLTSFCLTDPQYAPKIPAIVSEAAQLVGLGKLHTPVAAVYPVSDYARAVTHAIEGGKVVLDLRPGRWA